VKPYGEGEVGQGAQSRVLGDAEKPGGSLAVGFADLGAQRLVRQPAGPPGRGLGVVGGFVELQAGHGPPRKELPAAVGELLVIRPAVLASAWSHTVRFSFLRSEGARRSRGRSTRARHRRRNLGTTRRRPGWHSPACYRNAQPLAMCRMGGEKNSRRGS